MWHWLSNWVTAVRDQILGFGKMTIHILHTQSILFKLFLAMICEGACVFNELMNLHVLFAQMTAFVNDIRRRGTFGKELSTSKQK